MAGFELSAEDARRIAIAAQGFGPRPRIVDRAAIRALADQLGVIQIDSVNVLVRSHFLPVFSRLGAYDVADLEALAYTETRALFEYWGHEASLLPVAMHRLFRWRMAGASRTAWGHIRRMAKQRDFVGAVLAIVGERGPIGAGDVEDIVAERKPARSKRRGGWWERSDAKRALEWLFWSGQVTTAARRGFERLYDLPERVLPRAALTAPTPSIADAHRELIAISGRALGIASEADLRDYYRLKPAPSRAAIAELVAAGVLEQVDVEGWAKPAYLHRDASPPRASDRAALLSPFDALVWHRDRTERLFGMKFRLEIYVPEPKRVHGYYVLPFLLGDRMVARVDLKADRAASTLRVQASHAEARGGKPAVAAALARELRLMATWLGLEKVHVVKRGDLAPALAKVLR